jgi:hypothetical protein
MKAAKQTHQPQISTSKFFVPVSEELQKITSNSIKRIMIAALQRHANHALKETDLCSQDSDGTVSSESSANLTVARGPCPSILPTHERSIP